MIKPLYIPKEVFELDKPEKKKNDTNLNTQTTTRLSENDGVKLCVDKLVSNRVNIAESHEDWTKIAFAVAELGENGRDFFHSISQLSSKYNFEENDKKYSEALKSRTGKIGLGTFFEMCKNYGVTYIDELKATIAPNQVISKPVILNKSDWKNPIPINADLSPVDPMTTDMLPTSFADWLNDASERMSAPLDFLASAAICMVSSLIGTRCNVKPKKRDNWKITPNLWGCIIAPPSSLKSPCMAEVFKPLARLEIESRNKFSDERQKFKTDVLVYESRIKGLKSNLDKANKAPIPDEPTIQGILNDLEELQSNPIAEPIEKRYKINDATIEKIGMIMNDNPHGLLSLHDELAGLFMSWLKKGHEGDRTFYLTAWDGDKDHRVDRVGREDLYIKCVCLSVFGGLQPDVIFNFLQQTSDSKNDGALQRFQLMVYPDHKPKKMVDKSPNLTAKEKAYKAIETIAHLDFTEIGGRCDEPHSTPYIHFDDEAQQLFYDWYNELKLKIEPSYKDEPLIQSHLSKYPSLMPSLALIFFTIDKASSMSNESYSITASHVKMAIKWCNYLRKHAVRVYQGATDTIPKTAKLIISKLNSKRLEDGFSARTIQRKNWSGLNDISNVKMALELLEECFWIRPITHEYKGGRPPNEVYMINPEIFKHS